MSLQIDGGRKKQAFFFNKKSRVGPTQEIEVEKKTTDVEKNGVDLKSSTIHESLAREYPYDYDQVLHTIASFRKACGSFVNDDRFQMIMIALICGNALIVGVATFDFVTDDPVLDEMFQNADNMFLFIFTIEMALQLIYHGFNIISDWWLLFDLSIISLSWAFKTIQVVRAIRVLRALRLITHVQVMREIVVALLSVIPRMIAIGILLNIVMYIFAVMFTHLFKHTYDEGLTSHPYFSTLGNTMFTLFQMMTLDGWSEICQEVEDVYPFAWIPFVTYVIVSAFIIVNLIIAVICDSIADLQIERMKKERELEIAKAKMVYEKNSTAETMDEKDSEDCSSSRIVIDKADEMREMVEKLETDIVQLALYQAQTGDMMKYILEKIKNKQDV